MAQVNIAHFTDIAVDESKTFSMLARNLAAKEIHGLEESEIQADSVSVLVVPVDKRVSLSGADTEVQLLVSGNNWPLNSKGQPANAAEAKVHFDKIAESMHKVLAKNTGRRVYIWVTPFTASGWSE